VDDDLRRSHAGDVFLNPVTGERSVVLVGTGDGKGDRLAVRLHVAPGGAVVGEHYHPTITERFRVLAGRIEVSLDGRRDTLGPGADVTIRAYPERGSAASSRRTWVRRSPYSIVS
jgi:quercetin dioxygenase-like cupin family protein